VGLLHLNIVYSRLAVKTINGLDTDVKQRIKSAIEGLPKGDVKQLKGRDITTYRLRIGGWRVLYSLANNDTVFIEKISPRGQAYKGV